MKRPHGYDYTPEEVRLILADQERGGRESGESQAQREHRTGRQNPGASAAADPAAPPRDPGGHDRDCLAYVRALEAEYEQVSDLRSRWQARAEKAEAKLTSWRNLAREREARVRELEAGR